MSITVSLSVLALGTGCVTRTVGVRLQHTAYVADRYDPQSRQCVDRCIAEAQQMPYSADAEAASEAQNRVAKCAARCPGVTRMPETACVDAVRTANTSCVERAKWVKVREANPAGIAGVALGGAAFTAFMILFLTGHVNTQ